MLYGPYQYPYLFSRSHLQSYGFSPTVTVVPPTFGSNCIFAEKFSGMMMVSFLSEKRYIADSLVLLTRAWFSAFASALSSFVTNEGVLLYMPSLNLCPSSEDEVPASIPQEVSSVAAHNASTEVFFMFILLIYL